MSPCPTDHARPRFDGTTRTVRAPAIDEPATTTPTPDPRPTNNNSDRPEAPDEANPAPHEATSPAYRKLRASEADTRAKVIDRVLREVCGWPEQMISREDHVNTGFLDYTFSLPGRGAIIVVEAKREGVTFELPTGKSQSLKLSGSILTDPSIRDAVKQVRGYCDDGGVRYAVATNGYTWIVFRAVRDDMPWREGHARVFNGLEETADRFTEFWNLLSYEAVASGAFEDEFSSSRKPSRTLMRVDDGLYNADLPLQRNRLHAQLAPLIKSIFAEIADQEQVEILASCYVHSASLQIVAADLECVITDSVPHFLESEGAVDLRPGADSGYFSGVVTRAMSQPFRRIVSDTRRNRRRKDYLSEALSAHRRT